MSATYVGKDGNTYCRAACLKRNKLCHFFLGSAVRKHWPGQRMFYYECYACGCIHLTKKNKGKGYRRLPAYP